MTARALWAGAGALALVAVAIALALRPGDEPVAAARPASSAIQAPVDNGPTLARLGEQQVGSGELKALFAQLPEDARASLRGDRPALEAWIRARLAEKALYQQAEAQGWLQRPDIQAQTRAATEQIVLRDYLESVSKVPDDYPSETELKQAYEAGKAGLQLPARYRLSQIFLRVENPRDDEAVRKQAQALAKQAQASDADFAALAREHSQDAGTAANGGDTGLQALAQLLAEVRGVVSRLKVGTISEPVQSAAGYHIVKLVEQQPARAATFDEVAPRLRQLLRAQRQEQVAKAYVEGMFDSATLSIDGAALNKVLESSH
ncbi:peptidylprolyl isomerase [Pseudomonas entomophila]|uniref:peptidylprolyl isomerase n=1 Tax=Pseudomonas entomophila TaxID=312306 RepID=UPI0024062903|nr:peptidylprolyl isomerase [Pseudomonas entomophila]MDF9616312.1 peptidylprolyl isomerase [Pseudomonas entomophila]